MICTKVMFEIEAGPVADQFLIVNLILSTDRPKIELFLYRETNVWSITFSKTSFGLELPLVAIPRADPGINREMLSRLRERLKKFIGFRRKSVQKYANFTPWIWLTATRCFISISWRFTCHILWDPWTPLTQTRHSISDILVPIVSALKITVVLTVIQAELKCLLLCDTAWKSTRALEVSIENQANGMLCVEREGRAWFFKRWSWGRKRKSDNKVEQDTIS